MGSLFVAVCSSHLISFLSSFLIIHCANNISLGGKKFSRNLAPLDNDDDGGIPEGMWGVRFFLPSYLTSILKKYCTGTSQPKTGNPLLLRGRRR